MAKKEKLKDPNRLGFGRLMAWKSSDISAAWVNVIMLNFLSIYASDTLGINIGTVATLLLVSKIVDGITDVVAGWLVDNTHTKWGKGRPYELGIIGMTLCTILLFAGNPAWSNAVKCGWIFCMYTLTFSIFSTLRAAAGTPYTIRHFSNNPILIRKVASYGGHHHHGRLHGCEHGLPHPDVQACHLRFRLDGSCGHCHDSRNGHWHPPLPAVQRGSQCGRHLQTGACPPQ